MKLLLSLSFIIATCILSQKNQLHKSETTDIIQLASDGWISTSSDLSTLNLGNSCLIADLEIIKGNLTDSIVYLKDSCSNKTVTILAGRYRYPDGSRLTKSKIYQDTIKTISVISSVGNYEEDYYELISDSITTILKIEKLTVKIIFKDSIRQSERINR
jgi:hypothetical protein